MNISSVRVVARLSEMDHIAHATLVPASWARYIAYRNALIADGLDAERVVEVLSLFLSDLSEGCSVNGVH